MTFIIMVLFLTINLKDSQHNDTRHKHNLTIMLSDVMLNVVFSYCYAECCFAECHYAECCGAIYNMQK
jgi:hypothetical protein